MNLRLLDDHLLRSSHHDLSLQAAYQAKLASSYVSAADSFDQRLLECHLPAEPEPKEVRGIHDVFGNCVTGPDFASSSSMLKFDTTISLEH